MTGPGEETRRQLARASRRAALVSALGAVVLLGSLVFSGLELRALGGRKAVLQREIAALEEEKESLEQQWEVASRYQAEQRLLARAPAVRDDKRLPLGLVVEPKARATRIGKERYRFELWLDVPAARAGELAAVDYYFNHPSFAGNKRRSSRAPPYRVAYEGWGALSRVILTLERKDGGTEKITFNMHEYVNRAGTRVPEKGVPEDAPLEVPVYQRDLERLRPK